METTPPQPKNRGGRPRHSPELRPRMMSFRIPPDVAELAREFIPDGKRSQVVAEALAAEVARRKAQAVGAE